MKKRHITQIDVLFLTISMFVMVVLWIVFNLYHKWVTTTISPDLQMQIIPIAPKFDVDTINKLKTREQIEPIFELSDTPQASSPAEENTSETLQLSPTETQPTQENTLIEPTPTEAESTSQL